MSDATAKTPTKGARTRQALLECAIKHFAAAGKRGASVPAIAREVGITSSAVYAYFPSKKALFDAAIDLDASGLIADAFPDLSPGSLDLDFNGIFRRLLEAMPDHPLVARVLAGHEMTGHERLVALPAEKRLLSTLSDGLRRAQSDGTVRGDVDPDLMATGLEAIIIALLSAILQMEGLIDRDISRGVLAVLDAAVRPPQGRA